MPAVRQRVVGCNLKCVSWIYHVPSRTHLGLGECLVSYYFIFSRVSSGSSGSYHFLKPNRFITAMQEEVDRQSSPVLPMAPLSISKMANIYLRQERGLYLKDVRSTCGTPLIMQDTCLALSRMLMFEAGAVCSTWGLSGIP